MTSRIRLPRALASAAVLVATLPGCGPPPPPNELDADVGAAAQSLYGEDVSIAVGKDLPWYIPFPENIATADILCFHLKQLAPQAVVPKVPSVWTGAKDCPAAGIAVGYGGTAWREGPAAPHVRRAGPITTLETDEADIEPDGVAYWVRNTYADNYNDTSTFALGDSGGPLSDGRHLRSCADLHLKGHRRAAEAAGGAATAELGHARRRQGPA